jgi:hypothetical protein
VEFWRLWIFRAGDFLPIDGRIHTFRIADNSPRIVRSVRSDAEERHGIAAGPGIHQANRKRD